MSTVRDVQYHGGGESFVISVPTMVLMISPTSIMISLYDIQITKDDIPNALNTPHGTHDIPHVHHDTPTVLNIPQGIKDNPDSTHDTPTVLNTRIVQGDNSE